MVMKGTNFTLENFGPMDSWKNLTMVHPVRGEISGKNFLRSTLGLTGMEFSLNSIEEGASLPYFHSHIQNEELYVVLSGNGEAIIDDAKFPIVPGSAFRVAPKGERTLHSVDGGPLIYVVVQAKENTLLQANRDDANVPDRKVDWSI